MIRSCSTAIAVLLFLTPIDSALAALPGPPESYVTASPDGMHILVMLAPGTVDELHAQYAASGYYELCSDAPLWTVSWFEGNCHLSEDGRYLVRCNPYPEPERGLPASWAVKFYDRGREIASYDLADLVVYPKLMMWGSHAWMWTERGRDATYPGIHEKRFHLNTSTRERYSFDITTGTMVEQSHFWKHVSTAGKVALLLCAGGLALWYFGSRTQRAHQPLVAAAHHSYRFSIRTLLIFMAICAVFAAVFRSAPHVGIFMTSALLPLVLIVALRPSRVVSTIRRCAYRGMIFISLLPFYVLSIGPVSVFLDYLDVEYDFRLAVIVVPYYPVYWLITETSGNPMRALNWYCNAWG